MVIVSYTRLDFSEGAAKRERLISLDAITLGATFHRSLSLSMSLIEKNELIHIPGPDEHRIPPAPFIGFQNSFRQIRASQQFLEPRIGSEVIQCLLEV